jgi:hypothetical protein
MAKTSTMGRHESSARMASIMQFHPTAVQRQRARRKASAVSQWMLSCRWRLTKTAVVESNPDYH